MEAEEFAAASWSACGKVLRDTAFGVECAGKLGDCWMLGATTFWGGSWSREWSKAAWH